MLTLLSHLSLSLSNLFPFTFISTLALQHPLHCFRGINFTVCRSHYSWYSSSRCWFLCSFFSFLPLICHHSFIRCTVTLDRQNVYALLVLQSTACIRWTSCRRDQHPRWIFHAPDRSLRFLARQSDCYWRSVHHHLCPCMCVCSHFYHLHHCCVLSTSTGMDLQRDREGGTWLAMNRDGRIGALLNVLKPLDKPSQGRKNRGQLTEVEVYNFLFIPLIFSNSSLQASSSLTSSPLVSKDPTISPSLLLTQLTTLTSPWSPLTSSRSPKCPLPWCELPHVLSPLHHRRIRTGSTVVSYMTNIGSYYPIVCHPKGKFIYLHYYLLHFSFCHFTFLNCVSCIHLSLATQSWLSAIINPLDLGSRESSAVNSTKTYASEMWKLLEKIIWRTNFSI